MIVYSSTHLFTKSVPTLEKGWHSLLYIIMCQTYCNPYILAFCSLMASS